MHRIAAGCWCLAAGLLAAGPECREDAIFGRADGLRALAAGGNEAAARAGFRALEKAAARCPPRAKPLTALADLALELGQTKAAVRLSAKAVATARTEPGEGSLEHAVALETQAQAWAVSRRWAAGEPGLREAMRIVESHGGAQSYLMASLLNTLATLHAGLEDPEGARRQLERSRRILEGLPASPLLAAVLHNLAAVSMREGRQELARESLEAAARVRHSLPRAAREDLERALTKGTHAGNQTHRAP